MIQHKKEGCCKKVIYDSIVTLTENTIQDSVKKKAVKKTVKPTDSLVKKAGAKKTVKPTDSLMKKAGVKKRLSQQIPLPKRLL